MPPGLEYDDDAEAECREQEREQRPGPGYQERPGRGLRLLLDLGQAAERIQQDAPHRQAEGPRHDAVTQLVNQDGQVEQDDERGGDQVARG